MAIQTLGHCTLENNGQWPSILRQRYSLVLYAPEEHKVLLGSVLLVFKQMNQKSDQICWILYEFTFDIFGEVKATFIACS